MDETALVTQAQQLPVTSIADINTIGTMVAQSGMFGSCTPGRGAVIAAICQQESMSLLEFKRSYHISDQGNVMMRSDRMLAEFMSRGGKVVWKEFSAERAAAEFTFGDNKDLLIAFTFEEADRAGYVRKNKDGSMKDGSYKKDPASMLRARLITRAVRMLCPGAVCGLYTPEEIADIEGDAPEPQAPRRVNAEVVDEPAADSPSPFDKSTICPMGKVKGTPWADMETEHLETAMGVEHPDMEPEHYEAIRIVLKGREVSANE